MWVLWASAVTALSSELALTSEYVGSDTGTFNAFTRDEIVRGRSIYRGDTGKPREKIAAMLAFLNARAELSDTRGRTLGMAPSLGIGSCRARSLAPTLRRRPINRRSFAMLSIELGTLQYHHVRSCPITIPELDA